MIKSIWKDYFNFSRKERNAVFILLPILIIVILLPLFFPSKKLDIRVDEKLQLQLDSLQQQEHSVSKNYVDSIPSDSIQQKNIQVTLVQFDPNKLDEQGFKQLGLSDKVIHTIINYRTKGGYFKTPQDIKKIY